MKSTSKEFTTLMHDLGGMVNQEYNGCLVYFTSKDDRDNAVKTVRENKGLLIEADDDNHLLATVTTTSTHEIWEFI